MMPELPDKNPREWGCMVFGVIVFIAALTLLAHEFGII